MVKMFTKKQRPKDTDDLNEEEVEEEGNQSHQLLQNHVQIYISIICLL